MIRKKLLSEALLLLFVRASGVVLQLLVILYLAAHLPIEQMGLFSLFFATMGIVRALGPLGVDQVSTKLLSVASADNKHSQKIQEISTAGIMITGAFIAVAMPTVFVVLQFFPLLDAYTPSQQAAFFIAFPAFALVQLMIGQLRGLGYNLLAQGPDAVGMHGIMFGIMLFVDAYIGALTLGHVMFALVIAAWCVLAFQLIVRFKLGNFLGPRPKWDAITFVFREAQSIFQAHTLTVGTVFLPVFMAAAFLGPAAVAVFEVARRFGIVFSLLTSSIGATYSPTYAKLAAIGDTDQLRRVLQDSGILGGVSALLYALCVFFAGETVIGIAFPDAYLAALIPMTIIALRTSVNAFFSPVSTMYLMSGQANIVRKFSFAALICLTLTFLLFAGVWGVTGAALAVFMGGLVRDGGLFVVYVRSTARASD